MTTPTTPETTRQRSEHLDAIRENLGTITGYIEAGEIPSVSHVRNAQDHATALAAERDQMRQYINELEGKSMGLTMRVERLQRAFLAAESCCEACAAYQDQTTELWLQRWKLEPGDLPSDEESN